MGQPDFRRRNEPFRYIVGNGNTFLILKSYIKQFDPLVLICCYLSFFGDDTPLCRAGAWNCFSGSDQCAGAHFWPWSLVPNHGRLLARCWDLCLDLSHVEEREVQRGANPSLQQNRPRAPEVGQRVKSRTRGWGTRFSSSFLSMATTQWTWIIQSIRSRVILPLPYYWCLPFSLSNFTVERVTFSVYDACSRHHRT